MARTTSLARFLAATDLKGYLVARSDDGRNVSWDPVVTVVTVLDVDGVTNVYAKFLDSDSGYRPDRTEVGYRVEFDADGKFLGANPLVLEGHGAFLSNDDSEARFGNEGWKAGRRWSRENGTYYIAQNAPRRSHYGYRTLNGLLESLERHSPVTRAKEAAQRAEQAVERQAEQVAKEARIKGMKPDVRQAVWSITNEAERAASEVRGNLKSIIARATEALERFDETAYVYDSDFSHLARMAQDAMASAAKVQALKSITNSELSPLFEGSPWGD